MRSPVLDYSSGVRDMWRKKKYFVLITDHRHSIQSAKKKRTKRGNPGYAERSQPIKNIRAAPNPTQKCPICSQLLKSRLTPQPHAPTHSHIHTNTHIPFFQKGTPPPQKKKEYVDAHKRSHQSSSSSFLAIAFFLASSASASEPARLGVGVLDRELSDPLGPVRLIPESRACSAAGFFPGRAGGVGAAGFDRPLATGGGGGIRGAGAGACSSTYAAGTQAWPLAFLASHHPAPKKVSNNVRPIVGGSRGARGGVCVFGLLLTYHWFPSG